VSTGSVFRRGCEERLRVPRRSGLATPSPSSRRLPRPLPGAAPGRAGHGLPRIFGLKVRVHADAGKRAGWASSSPQEEPPTFMRRFLDDEIRVVLASIGGNHSNQILPYLNFDLIAAHPKIIQGYSDVTVLLWRSRCVPGLRTFTARLSRSNSRVPGSPALHRPLP